VEWNGTEYGWKMVCLHLFTCYLIVRFLSMAKQEVYFYNIFWMKIGSCVFSAHLLWVTLYAYHTIIHISGEISRAYLKAWNTSSTSVSFGIILVYAILLFCLYTIQFLSTYLDSYQVSFKTPTDGEADAL